MELEKKKKNRKAFQREKKQTKNDEHIIVIQVAAYLEAGVVTKVLTIDEVRGDPFITEDQPGTGPDTLRSTWLLLRT